MVKSCEHDAGLRIVGGISRKSLKIKRKSKISDELPRKYAKPNRFAPRVGQKAAEMKSLHSVIGLLFSGQDNLASVSDMDEVKPKIDAIAMTGAVQNQMVCKHKEKKSYSQFTPSLHSADSSNLDKHLLKNRPHAISLLQLKSLEPVLPRES